MWIILKGLLITCSYLVWKGLNERRSSEELTVLGSTTSSEASCPCLIFSFSIIHVVRPPLKSTVIITMATVVAQIIYNDKIHFYVGMDAKITAPPLSIRSPGLVNFLKTEPEARKSEKLQ